MNESVQQQSGESMDDMDLDFTKELPVFVDPSAGEVARAAEAEAENAKKIAEREAAINEIYDWDNTNQRRAGYK